MAIELRQQLTSHEIPKASNDPTARVVLLLIMLFGCWGQATAAGPIVLNLWPGRPPGETKELPPESDQTKPVDKLIAGRRIIKLGNVSTPQIAVYRPAPEKDTGAAVVVCPGGGHHILAYDLEGTEVAEWLTSIGVTGIVLKYRVPFRNPDQRWLAAVQDAQRAMRLVRSKAREWNVDPARIGICGFSAGGETAGLTSLLTERQYEVLDEIDQQPFRPNFALLIYPGGFTAKEGDTLRDYITVPNDVPPMFFVHAFDDHVTVQNSLLLASAIKSAGGSAELHLFATGGHGYGLRPTAEAITRWPARAAEWMRERGFLDRKDNAQAGHPADHLPPHIGQVSVADDNRALVTRFCADCHGADTQEAEINLVSLVRTPTALREDFGRLNRILRAIESGEMPPNDAEPQPSETQRHRLVDLPQDVRDHMRLMLDLILLAWRMDKTRVATLIFNRDVSHMQFGFLDGVPNEQLHGISHHKDNPEKLAAYQRINQFHVEQLGYLLGRMQAIDEGAGTTLLDNVMLLFGSNMFNGDSHDGRNLPLVLAGHGGGTIAGGRAIDFGDKPEEQQRACNLYISLARRMGLELNQFGDSVGPLEGLG